MNATLVLNADAQPVSVVPLSTVHWHDAIRIIYLERAVVLAEYNRWVVRSPSVQMRMPSIIMLTQYQEHNGKVEFSRYNVILRDNYRCQYCGETFSIGDLTYDHVIPKKDKGKTEWTNIVSACVPCNQRKAHHNKMKPRRKAHRPSYWELAGNRKKHPITVPHESWKEFLFWDAPVTIDSSLRDVNYDDDVVESKDFSD